MPVEMEALAYLSPIEVSETTAEEAGIFCCSFMNT